MRKLRAQTVLANVVQQGEQRDALRRLRRRRPACQQLVAHLVLQLSFAFQQRCPPRQPGLQRRAFQQIEKPAVKGRHRRPRLCGQHRFQQPARARQQRVDFAIRHRPFAQECAHRRVVLQRQHSQPRMQTVGHLLRRLAREGDRQQFGRRSPSQQQAQHARHQQPGLAAAGAGFHHRRADGGKGGGGVEGAVWHEKKVGHQIP